MRCKINEAADIQPPVSAEGGRGWQIADPAPAKSVLQCCCALVIFSLAANLGAAPVQAPPLKYEETLHLTWGIITAPGKTNQEPSWYATTPPTFANGSVFTSDGQSCLSNGFAACTGRLGASTVWVINKETIQTLFPRSLPDNSCSVVLESIWAPPPPPHDGTGNASVDWTLKFLYKKAVDYPLPTLEFTLLVDENFGGKAFEIPIDRLLADAEVRRYANVPPDALNAIAANQAWIRLFLAAPPLKSPPDFPPSGELQDLKGFEVPLGFALAGLAKIVTVLGPDRHFTDATYNGLKAGLDPQSSKAATYPWFPEPDASQARLPNTTVTTPTKAGGIVLIGTVLPGAPSDVARVLPTNNEWAIRVGPFRRVQPATARVAFVHGRTNNFPVEKLPLAIPDPKELAKWQAAIAKVEQTLKAITDKYQTGRGEYFWLPDLARPHAETVREIEGSPYYGGVVSSFNTNHFHYDTTYKLRSISGKVGVLYDPEHGFGGGGELNIADWPWTGDQLSLTGTNTEHDLEGSLDYKFPYFRSLDRSTTYQLDAVGNAGDDTHFRLGSLSQIPFEHRHQQGGVKHQFQHTGDGWDVSIVDSIVWDAHTLQGGLPGRRRDEGLLLRDQQSWDFAPPHSQTMRWDYHVAPSIAYGPEIGWQAAFLMGELQAGTKVSFGGEQLDNMSVSLRGSFGSSSDRLPPELLYRLGDADRLFGLEAGEFSGRSYVHGELAYGLSLAPILGGLFKDARGNATPPPALAGLGVEALAEIGSISSNSAFRSVTNPDKVVSSYGVALTKSDPVIAGGGLRLGYAWSPDGIHTHGRVFAALNWSF